MKPVELAKELAKSLTNSSEYVSYKAAKEKLENHEAAKLMFDDFRKKQMELEHKTHPRDRYNAHYDLHQPRPPVFDPRLRKVPPGTKSGRQPIKTVSLFP